MWYRTSAMGAANLPKIIEEIVEAARSFYKPIPLSGENCNICGTKLINSIYADMNEYNRIIDDYKQKLSEIGFTELEQEKYLHGFQEDLKEENYCPKCKAEENPYMYQFDFHAMNDWLRSWRDTVRQRIMKDESLLGSFLNNTKFTTEDKIIRIEKVTSDLFFKPSDDSDFRGEYDNFLNCISLWKKPINKREVDFYLVTIRHELGHAFSQDKRHGTLNTIYDKQKSQDLFDRLMLDTNIQVNSLENIKKIDINQFQPLVERRIKEVFGPDVILESGLVELVAKIVKNIQIQSKQNLMKKLDYDDELKKMCSFYLYFTSPTETPTWMMNMKELFSAYNLEKFRVEKFRNISKQSYCNYIKDTIRNWNSQNILKYIDSVSSSSSEHLDIAYQDLFFFMEIDGRPRIKKFIRQLQKNLVYLVDEYCSK